MLADIDLSRKASKSEYKEVCDDMELRLGALQRRAHELNIPVLVVFEGWDAAGKGTLINNLILPLDPRGFKVYSTLSPNEEEALRPFLWRFWCRTPAQGRIAIFDRSWYRRVLSERVEQNVKGCELERAFHDIRCFERQLADDGCVIIKFFLHIAKAEQKRRFAKLKDNPATAWRVSKNDLKRHRQYEEYLQATDEMLVETDCEAAPWTVVEAHDRRWATLKIQNTLITTLEQRIQKVAQEQETRKDQPPEISADAGRFQVSIIDSTDLSLAMADDEYSRKLKEKQKKLRELEHQIYMKRVPVAIVYEGIDAAGKGGNIRRLTQRLDPRGYEVVPIAAPNDIEKAHHYLWRFWTQFPKAGHITIFDRSWYGRVLVERVEGFCSTAAWKRAYREINEMEEHFTNFGGVLVKFWVHIDEEEQLRRFRAREESEHKQWKITDEDWRNREKAAPYKEALEEMLFRTSTPDAPWTIVESNCKRFARVKALNTVIAAIENQLKAEK